MYEKIKNINKVKIVQQLENKLRHEQIRILRKYECLKKQIKKGEATRRNIQKQL